MLKFALFSVLSLFLANTLASDSDLFQGTWVLNSIQVNENSADSVVLKTFLPDERYEFDFFRISRFSLDEASETVPYTLTAGRSFSEIPYRLTSFGISSRLSKLKANLQPYRICKAGALLLTRLRQKPSPNKAFLTRRRQKPSPNRAFAKQTTILRFNNII
jgi:hypothetical protein